MSPSEQKCRGYRFSHQNMLACSRRRLILCPAAHTRRRGVRVPIWRRLMLVRERENVCGTRSMFRPDSELPLGVFPLSEGPGERRDKRSAIVLDPGYAT